MNYKCKNCGGSMVYSPKHKTMFCPHCSQVDSEELIGNDSLETCPFCSAPLEPGRFDSSSICPYCDNYIVYDKRVEGEYKPDYVIPFAYDKQDAIAEMETAFKKRIFIPSEFWSEKKLKGMKGCYVPFFLYDYMTHSDYSGTGTRTRSWSQGNYSYTETSYYDIRRIMNVDYENIPADASTAMPDDTMDLMEPFDYTELMEFDPKYLSGFFCEIYNNASSSYESHAQSKAIQSATSLLRESVMGYSLNTPVSEHNTAVKKSSVKYALFPVWLYDFEWAGKKYPIYVNGQTKKIIGNTPISVKKVLIYAFSNALLLLIALEIILNLMGVL